MSESEEVEREGDEVREVREERGEKGKGVIMIKVDIETEREGGLGGAEEAEPPLGD